MKRLVSISLSVAATLACAQAQTIFTGDAGDTPFTSSQFGTAPGPTVFPTGGNPGGFLQLTDDVGGQNNVVAFNRTSLGLFDRSTFRFDFRIFAQATPSADGFGFTYLNTTNYGATGAGPAITEDPAFAGVLGVGFDTWANGAPNDFGPAGSSDYHDISLFYNGTLISRIDDTRLLPTPLTLDDGQWHSVVGTVDFQNARFNMTVDGRPIFTDLAVPGLTRFESRIAYGGRTGGENEFVSLDNLNVQYVPEPSTAAALAIGSLVLLRRRRR